MSWVELETRARQEVFKRLDVALCGVGLHPGRNGLAPSSSAPGKFFFSSDELPQRVALLRQHLPLETAEIVAEADRICQHRLRLLGYRDLAYAAEIDWHLDAVHGLRSPLIPWFKIDFLNFSQIGDHKVTWELNRQQHLVTLAKAWLFTGEPAYAEEIFAQWYSWQRANPYPLGANWASSLEVAFRSLSWIWVHHLLADCPTVPPRFENDLLHALALNGRHIECYLSTYFSPNTHLLGEAVALFFIGALYPQISSAENWKRNGWRIVQEEARRQVRPDGVYFEQSLYYHVYALDFFLHARLLAWRNGIEVPSEFDIILRKMLAVIRALAQAGPPEGFGDDDGGRLFNSARNRAEHMTDPLTIGGALFRDDHLRITAPLTEESIWLFGEQAISFAATEDKTRAVKPQNFPDGGLYILGSSDPIPQQMVIDAGPQGTGRCGHGHADALSVSLAVAGRRWLVDPGSCCYIGPSNNGGGNDRNTFRGTRAHNTLTVDGADQAEPEGPFAWSSIPKTETDLWVQGKTFTLFAGSHSGYERLRKPVRHQRFVFHLHGNFWLVRDVAHGTGRHLLEISWHFAPGIQVAHLGSGFVAGPLRNQASAAAESTALTLLPLEDAEWNSELLSDCVSPTYGEKIAALVLRCSADVELPAEDAVLITASLGSAEGTEAAKLLRDERSRADGGTPSTTYHFDHNHTTHWMVFRHSQPATWSFGPWTSDARFLYFCVKDQRVGHLVFCEGSFAQLRGEAVISYHGTLQWLEWTNRDSQDSLACSDETVRGAFFVSALNSEIDI